MMNEASIRPNSKNTLACNCGMSSGWRAAPSRKRLHMMPTPMHAPAAPSPMMSRDNVRSLRVDNIASGPPLPFGLVPTSVEAVAPTYIGNESQRARYYSFRNRSRHRPD